MVAGITRNLNQVVTLTCVKAHNDVAGNEKADQLAKAALEEEVEALSITQEELK